MVNVRVLPTNPRPVPIDSIADQFIGSLNSVGNFDVVVDLCYFVGLQGERAVFSGYWAHGPPFHHNQTKVIKTEECCANLKLKHTKSRKFNENPEKLMKHCQRHYGPRRWLL